MLSLSQLIVPVTEDEALETSLGILNELGMQATSWQTGSIQLTLLRLFCRTWSNLATVVSAIASGGFTSLATKNWLTLMARHCYNLERIDAQPTIGKFLLTSSAGAPVHTWDAGDLIVADAPNGTDGANTYTCTEAGTLGPDDSVVIEFKADVPGTDANIAPDTTLYFWTPLVGVEAENPSLSSSNTWITTPGQDEEADSRLAARCLARFDKLTYGNTDGAYRGWALDALNELTRVHVVAEDGDAEIRIIGATALGALTSEQEGIIEDYINGVNDGIGRRPINDIITVESAEVLTTPAIDITAYVVPTAMNTAGPAMVVALQEYFGSLPIGGTTLTTTTGYVLFDKINEICRKVSGVVSVTMNITANIELADNQIYVPAITVNTVAVSP